VIVHWYELDVELEPDVDVEPVVLLLVVDSVTEELLDELDVEVDELEVVEGEMTAATPSVPATRMRTTAANITVVVTPRR